MPCKALLRSRILWRPVRCYHNHSLAPKRRHPAASWPRNNLIHDQRRAFGLSSIPTVLLPPVVFTGLLITLWTYKCLMMIIFQNKIIYMPSMPPFSRSEKVEDYANMCKPVIWTEHSLRSEDGTPLKMLEGQIPLQNGPATAHRQIVIVYFQGNGSSTPPRLPHLSNVLKLLQRPESDTQYTLLALSYRGFWKSKGRPSQRGIELDAQAALSWVSERYVTDSNTKIVLWGQSIGAGVATTALATWQDRGLGQGQDLPVAGLLLETPFTSLRAMLIALYPQKFLPYRYLGPFLLSTWDSMDALSRIGKRLAEVNRTRARTTKRKSGKELKVLLLEAENDELVPKEDATTLYKLCTELGTLEAQHKVVAGGLHTDVMIKNEGKREIVKFLRSFE